MPPLNDTQAVGVTFVVLATITTLTIVIIVLCKPSRQPERRKLRKHNKWWLEHRPSKKVHHGHLHGPTHPWPPLSTTSSTGWSFRNSHFSELDYTSSMMDPHSSKGSGNSWWDEIPREAWADISIEPEMLRRERLRKERDRRRRSRGVGETRRAKRADRDGQRAGLFNDSSKAFRWS